MTAAEEWPELPYAEWRSTKETFHRYAQIIGKVRMALTPPRNHWWHVTLYVTATGLSTGPIPTGGRDFAISFDLRRHRLSIADSLGESRELALTERPACADFYADLFAALHSLGIEPEIDPTPFDLGESPDFPDDRENASYDGDAIERFWRILASTQRVLFELMGGFVGKASPVQLFWHSFDLAHARFSGRAADTTGMDRVSAEAYSHEVIAFGFWPGDDRRTPYPAFYSYTAPEPDGLTEEELRGPRAAWHDTGNGSLAIQPYEDLRLEPEPDRVLLDFFTSAYEAGAERAGWDRDSLEPSARLG